MNYPTINDLVPKDPAKYTNPKFFNKGMTVYVRWDNSALRCVVTVAAGDHALVVNKERGFSRWFNKWEVLIQI
jgi:hypothetical protein